MSGVCLSGPERHTEKTSRMISMSLEVNEGLKTLYRDKLTKSISKKLDQVIVRIANVKDRQIWFDHMFELLRTYKFPLDLLDKVPERAMVAGKTRFDQLYDMCCEITFPPYSRRSLEKMIGKNLKESDLNIKIWKCYFNEELNISNVLIRASNHQEAFAKASDFACRVYLKQNKIIPRDITVRVVYVPSSTYGQEMTTKIKKRNYMNRKNYKAKGKIWKLSEMESAQKRIEGIEISTLGHPTLEDYSIYKYIEKNDLKDIAIRGIKRISSVEAERYFMTQEEKTEFKELKTKEQAIKDKKKVKISRPKEIDPLDLELLKLRPDLK